MFTLISYEFCTLKRLYLLFFSLTTNDRRYIDIWVLLYIKDAYTLFFSIINMSLLTVSQQITIYSGFILAIGGIFGNLMNILIFSTYQTLFSFKFFWWLSAWLHMEFLMFICWLRRILLEMLIGKCKSISFRWLLV